jgi:hypothetical protein
MMAPAGAAFSDIASGYAHIVGREVDGSIQVWGDTWFGLQLSPPGVYAKAVAGNSHCAALRHDGIVACWGYNDFGQCNAPSEPFVDVTCTHMTTVALRADGSVTKWGDDYGAYAAEPPPALSRLNESAWFGGTAIGWDSADRWHAWAVDGRCSGFTCGNTNGLPPPPNSNPLLQIVTNGNSAVAIRADGYLTGWGSNQSGSSRGPLSFPTNRRFQCIATGNSWGGIRVPCPADLDSNDSVDAGDISIALLEFGACDSCDADLDQSGEVDAGDISLMLLDFGRCQ